MKKYQRKIIGFILLVLVSMISFHCASGQVGYAKVAMDSVQARLSRLSCLDSAYRAEIDVSVGNLPLSELLRNIARMHEVNICVKASNNRMVSCNFNRVKLVDLLYFLCKEYNLNLEVIGNIVSLNDPQLQEMTPRIPDIGIDSLRKKLRYDLLDDPLIEVVKRISALTDENIMVPRELYSRRVSGYSAGLPVIEAIQMLATINGLEMERRKSGVWEIFSSGPSQGQNNPVAAYARRRNFTNNQVGVDSLGQVTVSVDQGNIQDIVSEICDQLKINRLFLTSLNQQTSVFVKNAEVSTFLNVLFAGTPFTYQVENGIYVFGSTAKDKQFLSTKVIPLRYRTVDKVLELIPATLKEGVQIQVYAEQNSVIASGTSRQIERIENFLGSIDESIPLVTIEVMIVDSKKSMIQEVGIDMGIGEPANKAKTLSPGLNMLLTSSSINKLINSFNGFGSINLGKVTPDFYINLQALESNGNIELRSTPKLSTLNGHKATLRSGEKKYYKEVQTNYYGSQTPVPSESYTWKEVNADLSLEIVPFVSKDGKITLNIKIRQSQFTEREGKINEEAPPGAVVREFESQIQVCDQEMVLLGGIDNNTKEKSASGLPFIARVPVLKWIFGKSKNNKVDQKLNVFIKPNVIY